MPETVKDCIFKKGPLLYLMLCSQFHLAEGIPGRSGVRILLQEVSFGPDKFALRFRSYNSMDFIEDEMRAKK